MNYDIISDLDIIQKELNNASNEFYKIIHDEEDLSETDTLSKLNALSDSINSLVDKLKKVIEDI